MKTLKRLQKLSLGKRKIIFWAVTVVLGLVFLIAFIFVTANRLKNFQVDNLREEMNLPSFDLPEFEN